MEEEMKKISPSCLSELRLESSWAAIDFSDPCPCCGSKKRRCRQPLARPRKKLLVFETPSPPGSQFQSQSKSPRSTAPIAPLSVQKLAMNGVQTLERSGSSSAEQKTLSSLSEERKERQEEEESVTEVQLCPEICVSVRCHCGIAREIVLRR